MSRVLLVDDDPDGRDLRAMLLEHSGHQVVVAADPVSARACFRENLPDCVILDLRIPDREDGLALIRDFRHVGPSVRIVVLAGEIADLDGRAETLMIDDILAKPVRSERLMSAVAPQSK